MQSRFSFSPLSFSLPLSNLLMTEDVLGEGWCNVLGGEPDTGNCAAEGPLDVELPLLGMDSLYHPPEYVNAMSWYSIGVGSLSDSVFDGASIHPTMHRSSSGKSPS
jgi:hypothetical protein